MTPEEALKRIEEKHNGIEERLEQTIDRADEHTKGLTEEIERLGQFENQNLRLREEIEHLKAEIEMRLQQVEIQMQWLDEINVALGPGSTQLVTNEDRLDRIKKLRDLCGRLVGARKNAYTAIYASEPLRTHPHIKAVFDALRQPEDIEVKLVAEAREKGVGGED